MSTSWRRTYALGALLCLSMPSQAATWIQDFGGKPSDYELKRAGQSIPIEYYLELRPCDELSVLNLTKGHELALKRDDGSEEKVTIDNSPYYVQSYGKPPGIITNVIAWVGRWTTGRVKAGEDRSLVSLTTRTEVAPVAISVPLAPGGTAKLAAGTRPLHLYWQGGEPPFRLQLIATADNRIVMDERDIRPQAHHWRFTSAPIGLEPGQYRLEIGDAERQQDVEIQVVPLGMLPSLPELEQSTPADIRETAYAVWLAAQGEVWTMEAYQRAVALQDRDPPARILMYSLERGVRPPPPPSESAEGAH